MILLRDTVVASSDVIDGGVMSGDGNGDQQVRLSAEVVASSIAAAAIFVSPGAAALAVAGQPLLAAGIERLAIRGLSRVLGIAADESGSTVQQLVDELAASDDGVRLLVRTIEVARLAADDEKLRVLGRCLAEAVADDARIDEDMLLVGAIAVLEMPHFRMLRAMTHSRPRVDGEGGPEDAHTWGMGDLHTVDEALTPDVADSLIGLLVSQGVVATQSGYGGLLYVITSLGRLLLVRARDVASDV